MMWGSRRMPIRSKNENTMKTLALSTYFMIAAASGCARTYAPQGQTSVPAPSASAAIVPVPLHPEAFTGQWEGAGKSIGVLANLIGCNPERCLYSVDVTVPSGIVYSRPTGRAEFTPPGAVSFDSELERGNRLMTLSLEAAPQRVTFRLGPCEKDCSSDFAKLAPEEVELHKINDVPAFSPSFDCGGPCNRTKNVFAPRAAPRRSIGR